MWEQEMKLDEIREIRTRTFLFLGIGAINKMYDIAQEFSQKGT